MDEKIQGLYEEINRVGFRCMYYKGSHYLEQAKALIPQVEEFARWFLGGDSLGLGKEDYGALSENLIGILQDCADALEEGDQVLLMDALEQGILEYLGMFLPESYFAERETVYVEKNAR